MSEQPERSGFIGRYLAPKTGIPEIEQLVRYLSGSCEEGEAVLIEHMITSHTAARKLMISTHHRLEEIRAQPLSEIAPQSSQDQQILGAWTKLLSSLKSSTVFGHGFGQYLGFLTRTPRFAYVRGQEDVLMTFGEVETSISLKAAIDEMGTLRLKLHFPSAQKLEGFLAAILIPVDGEWRSIGVVPIARQVEEVIPRFAVQGRPMELSAGIFQIETFTQQSGTEASEFLFVNDVTTGEWLPAKIGSTTKVRNGVLQLSFTFNLPEAPHAIHKRLELVYAAGQAEQVLAHIPVEKVRTLNVFDIPLPFDAGTEHLVPNLFARLT